MASEVNVPGPNKGGTYTNTSARAHILLFKNGTGPQRAYRTLKIAPGEMFQLDAKDSADLEKTPAFRSGELKRGKHEMPPARLITLGKADAALALRLIEQEGSSRTLREWSKVETRPEVKAALMLRIQQLKS